MRPDCGIILLLLLRWGTDKQVVAQVIKVDVKGHNSVAQSWADSYYADGKCWCDNSNFAEGMMDMVVPTIDGQWWSLPDVCDALGGPGVKDGDPIYNDIQCGRGPPAAAPDELTCPGRVDLGNDGCGDFGTYWDFSVADPSKATNRVLAKPDDAHPDIVVVIDIVGEENPGGLGWADSYSVGGDCFCISTYDHNIGTFMYDTPSGYMSVQSICEGLGPGPGRTDDTPIYNDIQCGNGPPNSAGDEQRCPGRVDIGKDGCGHIGPKWRFPDATSPPTSAPTSTPTTATSPTTIPTTTTPSMPTTDAPTSATVLGPTPAPTPRPSTAPTTAGGTTSPPTTTPTVAPTSQPVPTPPSPTSVPTEVPSMTPSTPSPSESEGPSLVPSMLPSEIPSEIPSLSVSSTPSTSPSMTPDPPSTPPSKAPSTAPISTSTRLFAQSYCWHFCVLSFVTATSMLW